MSGEPWNAIHRDRCMSRERLSYIHQSQELTTIAVAISAACFVSQLGDGGVIHSAGMRAAT